MKLAQIIGHFPPGSTGGAEIQAERWAIRLAKAHDVAVITRRDRPEQPSVERRDGFTLLRTPVSPVRGWRTAADLASIGRAVRSLEQRPDLLLCFQTFVSGLAGVRQQARLGIPAVVWIRGEREYRLRESRRSWLVSPYVWDRATGVLVQSEGIRDVLLEQLRARDGAAAERVAAKLRVVPNGVEQPVTPAAGGRKILVLGRLIRDKGVDVVIEALAGIPGAEMLVAGDGPERSALESLAAARGVPATFLGNVLHGRLPELFARARCLVMASRFGEGFPNAVLEAMASGVPVVATPIAGIPELVADGRNGLTAGVDDTVALRGAVGRLLNDDDLRARLSAAGRVTAQQYSWDRVQGLLERTLAELAGAPVRRTT